MTGSTPSTSKSEYYSEDGIPWVTPTDIEATTILDTPRKLSEEGAKVGRVVPANTILCTCIASIGKNTLLMVKGSFNQQINSLTPYEENDAYFLLTESELWSNKMKRMAASGTMQIVNKTEFSELQTMVPKSAEQKQIGSYFRNLDHLITLHQRKCEETKTLKKYMLQKMFPQNGHSVPEIRFSGFTEDWEQRKFADFTWDAGKRNKEDLDLEPYAITNEHGFIRQRDAHDDFGYMKDTDRKAYNIVQPNSFAYNPARINVGSIGYYKGVENVIVSSLYEVFQTDNYVNDRFLWHWLKSDEFPRWIEKLQEGSVRLYFYYDKLCECQLYMPSLEEQEKIASFLDDLDNLITLHQRKYMKYADLSVFDWEQRKLDDVVEFLDTMRKPLEGAKRISGPYPYYGASGIVDYVDGYLFDEELILLSEDGANITDRNYPVCFIASGKYWVNNHAHVLRSKKGNENNFICNSLERKDYTQYNTGMAMPKLNKETCRKIPVLCPTFEEQQKIGDCFRSLDHLITLHHRKQNYVLNTLIYAKTTLFITKTS